MCAIGPKGEARTFEPRVPSGYLTPSNGYIGFPYHPLVRPKRHRTACAIGPKGEARIFGLPLDSIGVLHTLQGGGGDRPNN